MPRLAEGRARYLTRDEIARETLRQFDEQGREPSIRHLATALKVSPPAIYHHFPGRSEIVSAAVDLVFAEAEVEMFELLPSALDEDVDPVDMLIFSGVATRRAFLRHFRIAPFVAATPTQTDRLATTLNFMALIFERLGLHGEAAAEAFHTYSSFVIGAVIFAATRMLANEQLGQPEAPASGADGPALTANYRSGHAATREALRAMTDISVRDPKHDEELFADGIRRLIMSFRGTAAAAE